MFPSLAKNAVGKRTPSNRIPCPSAPIIYFSYFEVHFSFISLVKMVQLLCIARLAYEEDAQIALVAPFWRRGHVAGWLAGEKHTRGTLGAQRRIAYIS